MSFKYTVYEFSTGIIEECQEGRWVSGGFTGSIAKANFPVPDKLKQAIDKGYFKIRDNNVFFTGVNLAVIPEKIGNYYVLAVATLSHDESRPIVVYRYFWLEIHNDINTDGFATLLLWWFEAGQPRFEFSETPSLPQFAQPCTSVNFDGCILWRWPNYYPQIRVCSSIRSVSSEDIKKLELIYHCFDRLSKLELENAKIYLLINPTYENANLFILLCSNDSELKPILNYLRRLLNDSDDKINFAPPRPAAPAPPPAPPLASPVPTILSSKFLATLIITGLLAGFVYGFVTVILMNFSNKNMEDKKSPKIEKLVSPPILLNW
ncbi:MAG: hypothetical protein HEQ29_16740 [Dolichospermum sp. LBC05a]|nr:hypothetical protein [Dolichospermum sp. OL01]MCO5798330.1 hypothetical protein [Dolichospermum sp. OL03]MCS6283620.1 hypothetical protein [Dolichospermum sp.]QSV59775.1 MAG: hypothetical protein HEQ29_16740 [Dolichospermum sp. LBC05a]